MNARPRLTLRRVLRPLGKPLGGPARVLALAAALVPDLVRAADGSPADLFRLGFSASTIGHINKHDALVALRTWVREVSSGAQIDFAADPLQFSGPAEIRAALREKRIDAINLSAEEYPHVRDELAGDTCIVSIRDGAAAEELLVLARADAKLERLQDLRGRSLILLDGPRTRLGPLWLETFVRRERRESPATFFGPVSLSAKPLQTVLPVFLGQIDACLLPRQAFAAMCEQNPQLGQELKVLATSPAFVPNVFIFRKDSSPALRARLYENVVKWNQSARGRQILTVFQCTRLEISPVSCLDEILKLHAEHTQLGGAAPWQPGNPTL